MPPEVRLRPAIAADAGAIAAVFTRSRRANLPYLPVLHSVEEERAFIADHVLTNDKVWVAERGAIVGFIAWRQGWVDHLYLDVGWSGRGIGPALLAEAMADQAQLRLWVFRCNTGAIRFYLRHGFGIIGETDGSDNEERQPDLLLAWTARSSQSH